MWSASAAEVIRITLLALYVSVLFLVALYGGLILTIGLVPFAHPKTKPAAGVLAP